MKTVKSVLICALVALLGSSVWAAVTASAEPKSFAQVYKGESVVVTLKNSGTTAVSEANLKVNGSTSSSSGAAKTWTGTYLKAELSSGGLPARESQSVPSTATLTITGLETTDSMQTIQVWNSNTELAAITISKVAEPVEKWVCPDVIHLSHTDHPLEVVTNQFGSTIPWGDMTEADIVDDEDVAKVIKFYTNGVDCVAITNTVCDGDAVVSFTTGGTNYTYTVMAATVEISKTVLSANDPNNPNRDETNNSNATIRIVTHILNNPKPATPKVLFIGTACSSHVDGHAAGPMVEAISATVNGLTKKADVSARVVINTGSTSAPSFTVNANEFKMGSPEVTYTSANSSSDWTKGTALRVQGASHACMVTIYNLLKEIADNEKGTYDYIVMEFDGSRLGASQMANNGNNFEYQAETENATTLLRDVTVAKFLKEYYDLGRIIWIVDDSSTKGKIQNDSTEYFSAGSFFPLQSSNFDDSHKPEFIRIKSFRGMMGLLNPDVYLTWVNNDTGAWIDENWTSWVNNTANRLVIEKSKLDCPDGKMETAGEKYPGYLLKGHAIQKAADAPSTESEHWTTYNNADNITKLLEELVKPVPHDIQLVDNVITLGQTIPESMKIVKDEKGDAMVTFSELDKEEAEKQGIPLSDVINCASSNIWQEIEDKDHSLAVVNNTITGSINKIQEEYWCKIEIEVVTSPTFLKDAQKYKEENPDWPNLVQDPLTQKWIINPNEDDAQVTLFRGEGSQRVKCTAHAEGTTVYWEMPDDAKKLVIESSCVTNVYDGAYHTLTNYLVYKEGDAEKTPILDAIISNSLDKATWSITNTADFGFVNVTNDAPVYIQAFAAGYEPSVIANATVTITPRSLTNEFAVVAIDTNMVYGTTPYPTPTWKGGENLVKGDGLKVTLDYTNEVWDVGTYPDVIVTNALIAVTNSANEDVTKNYAIEFKPATLKVTPKPILPKNPKTEPPTNPDPKDPTAGNPEPENPPVPTLWAPNVVKYYDGIGTNTKAKVYGVEGYDFTYEYTTNDNLEVEEVWADSLLLTNVLRDVDNKVTSYKVYCRAKDEAGNYVGTNCFAWVTILPRPLTNEFAVVAIDTNMVYGAESAPTPTWKGGTDVAEGDKLYVNLCYTNEGASASWPVGTYLDAIVTNLTDGIVVTNKFGEDVTSNYVIEFKPGELEVTKAAMGFVALDVVKEYDGVATNIVMGAVTNKATGAAISGYTVSNSYDNAKWYLGSEFPGYTDVTNAAVVHIKVFADGYSPATGSATVTITPRSLTNEFAVVAVDTNMVYGTTPRPTPTWKGGENLVKGDGLKVTLDYTNEVWNVGTYPDAIVTNALIAVTNSANEDVTKNYAIEFKPATLTVNPAKITPKVPSEPDPADPKENPGEEPPEDPDGDPILWAQDIVKVYDGLGTNILPNVYYAVDGNNFTYEFATNLAGEASWFADKDHIACTNVVRNGDGTVGHYKVYYRAKNTEGNYLGVTNFAFVTILPAPVTIGPGENGPVKHPPYGEDPIPPAEADDPNSWTNGAVSVIKEYDGIPTNIIVEVTDPAGYPFVIDYSTNGVDFVNEGVFEGYTDPTNKASVWYAITDPKGNYVSVTNRAFVTIWKRAEEKKGDVPMDKGDLEQLNEDLKKVIDEDSGVHPFLKVQLTVDETNSLDNANTWIGPADAKAQAEAIVAASPVPVVDSHFYDIVLERTYEFAVAQNVQGVARNYNNSNRWENAGWDDIGDGTDQLLTIALRPFTAQQMEGKSLIGAYRHHGGSVELINEKSKVPAGSECYEIDTQDPLKIILHVKKFSIYGFLLKSNAAMLKATLDWAYNNGTGQYVAQLKVACTNGIENLDASDVKFAFEDRVDEENKPYATLKQWVANCRYAEDAVEETINGTKFRVCVIDAGAAQIKAAGLNQEITVGPASTAGSVVQMADRKAGYPCLFVADRLKPVAGNETSAKSTVKSFLGYVLWKASGTQWALPVTAGAAPEAAVDWPTQPLTQLLSVPRMNLCLSMGVSPSASGDFSCAVKEFAVTDGRISGRVGTSDGRRESVPSAASTVVLRGARTLDGEFDRLCELNCDEEGRFETDAPEGYPYFKVSIEPGSIVK